MNRKQKRWRNRIIVALVIFAAVFAVEESGVLATLFGTPGDVYASFALFLIPYLIAGYKTLLEAARIIRRGDPFDEGVAEAIMNVPCGEGEQPNCVNRVLKKGYRQGEKVIRFAQVIVTS